MNGLSYSFPKAARLRCRRDFQRLSQAHRKVGQLVVVEYRTGRKTSPRLGITVTRKYGKSHVRNRFKRLVREAFRHILSDLPPNLEINVRPRTAALKAKTQDIQAELSALFKIQR